MTIGKKYVTTLEQSSHSNYLKEQATSHSHLIHRHRRCLLLKKSSTIRWPCFAAVKCVFLCLQCLQCVCRVCLKAKCVFRIICFHRCIAGHQRLYMGRTLKVLQILSFARWFSDKQIGWTFYFKLTSCTCLWCLWGQSCLLCLYNVVFFFVATFQSELKVQFVLWIF